jgi:hypothetical protein
MYCLLYIIALKLIIAYNEANKILSGFKDKEQSTANNFKTKHNKI